ncbi:hypothetical protein BC828DRAFT_24191 [Blastocladiella britannica]|nr:hypothetical protein BC828DRAFT_24191 [Blastocladiella britannica]
MAALAFAPTTATGDSYLNSSTLAMQSPSSASTSLGSAAPPQWFPLDLSISALNWPAQSLPTLADLSQPPRPAVIQLVLTHPGGTTEEPVLFKFKTNAPALLRVKPSAGCVAPGTSAVVHVQCALVGQLRAHADNVLVQMCRASVATDALSNMAVQPLSSATSPAEVTELVRLHYAFFGWLC